MVIHPSYYDACDVIYYVIVVRARRMVCIFFLLYLGNRSKSDPCSYELICLESHILSFLKVVQIPSESPCILQLNLPSVFLIFYYSSSLKFSTNLIN